MFFFFLDETRKPVTVEWKMEEVDYKAIIRQRAVRHSKRLQTEEGIGFQLSMRGGVRVNEV